MMRSRLKTVLTKPDPTKSGHCTKYKATLAREKIFWTFY